MSAKQLQNAHSARKRALAAGTRTVGRTKALATLVLRAQGVAFIFTRAGLTVFLAPIPRSVL